MDLKSLPDLSTPVREMARPDAVRLLETETVSEALSRLRGETVGERIIYFYVTDREGTLVGVVPTRRLLLSDPASRIGEVMVHPVLSASASEPAGRALETLTRERLLALPVVDDQHRLTGVLDISTFTQTLSDLERRKTAEEVFQLVGVQVEQEKNRTVWLAMGNRFPWLLCNIASGVAAAVIAACFGDVLKAVVALAFFVPLVLTVAESIAMQSVTISVQSVHIAKPESARPGRRLFREMRVGTLLGIVSGGIVGLLGIAWWNTAALAAVLSGAVAIAGAIGAALGYSVPRLVHRWNLDPRIASGPAVLALTDIAAVASYFALAGMVLI